MNSICNQILVFNSIWDSNWILNSVSLTEFSNIFDLIFDFTIEFGEAHRIAKQIRFDLRIGHRIRWASPNSSNKSTDKVAQLNRLWLNRLPTLTIILKYELCLINKVMRSARLAIDVKFLAGSAHVVRTYFNVAVTHADRPHGAFPTLVVNVNIFNLILVHVKCISYIFKNKNYNWNRVQFVANEACNCDSTGSLSAMCDRVTGQCSCYENKMGKICDKCIKGHFNAPKCEKCMCNGHSEVCTGVNGVCIGCKGNTQGDHCEV